MANAELNTVTVGTVKLELDLDEAGYLLDLLYGHVGGSLSMHYMPLGRISQALRGAGVRRIRAYNSKGNEYASLYASEDDYITYD